VVSLLLQAKAAINGKDGSDSTPLLVAAAAGHAATVSVLIAFEPSDTEMAAAPKEEAPLRPEVVVEVFDLELPGPSLDLLGSFAGTK
jgi:ankyrin repeat protein